jgi:hypothetical protein
MLLLPLLSLPSVVVVLLLQLKLLLPLHAFLLL